jgi:peptidoglycan hydrolase-like protein with peptidoglycan-binding domain
MNRYKGIYVLPAMASVKKSYKVGVPDNSLKIYKQRLNTYLVDSGAKLMLHKLNVTSPNYDTAFVTAIKIFQKNFSKSLAVDGVLGAKTLEALHKGLGVSRICQAPEKLAIMMFQKANGLKIDGILGPSSRSKIKITVSVSKDTLSMGAEGEFAAYEASIWSEQSNYEASYNSNPHFYGAGQDVLRETGFDIYINYGPLVEDLRTDNKTGDLVSYNNTVKAIRGVQLTGMQQMLSPTGDVIAERYSFIARDLD